MHALRPVPPCEGRKADAAVIAGLALCCVSPAGRVLLPRVQDAVAVTCYPEKGATGPGMRAHCPTSEKKPAEPVLGAAQLRDGEQHLFRKGFP